MSQVSFILASSAHGLMIVNRNDVAQSVHGPYGVGYQILAQGAYDPDEITFVKEILSKRRANFGDGIVVLDCGANIGVHTVEVARYMSGWGSVRAFEAQERLFYALCGNIVLNNLSNASASLALLGDSNDTSARVPVPDYDKPASFGSLEMKFRRNTEFIGQEVSYAFKDMKEVPTLALDNLLLSRVDFIKLDVEGMEMEVLRGAQDTISTFHPDLLIEWIKSDRPALEDLLCSFGYSFIELGMNLFATQANETKNGNS